MTVQAGDGLPGFGDRDLPLAAGSLTGVRLWRVDLPRLEAMPDGGPVAAEGLLSGVFGAPWQRGENIAVCGGGLRPAAGHAEQVPAPCCGCGFWAYWAPRDALRSDHHRRAEVIGMMQGYGRTRIGTRGCRCGKARILALHVPERTRAFAVWDLRPQDAAEILARYYGVPWYPSLEAMLAAHPPTADYLPRHRQHLAAATSPGPAGAAPVRWARVAALAGAYAVVAGVVIMLAALWIPQALAAVVAVTVAAAIWPVGTLWLPQWARK